MIDIDHSGGSVIRIDHKISQDVRDRLVARFMTSPRPLERGERLLYALEILERSLEDEGIVAILVPLNKTDKL